MNTTNIRKLAVLGAVFLVITHSEPAHAQALFDSGTNFLNALMDLLTNVWARIIAIIAIVITGIIAMTGRLSWTRAGFVILGIILVFGAGAIVDSVAGNI
jgi:type IV secretion system protein VirB2